MFDSLHKHFLGLKWWDFFFWIVEFPFLDIKFLKKEIFDGLCDYFLDNKFVQFLKKEIFDGLHKCFLENKFY